jgi:hypothetical protein
VSGLSSRELLASTRESGTVCPRGQSGDHDKTWVRGHEGRGARNQRGTFVCINPSPLYVSSQKYSTSSDVVEGKAVRRIYAGPGRDPRLTE